MVTAEGQMVLRVGWAATAGHGDSPETRPSGDDVTDEVRVSESGYGIRVAGRWD
jgi:hypothetical protein